ncbi:MAG TPA: hypothetical protein PKD12_17870 [Nitrospira sp.]|nr:hypothetical protein [Nitrospira sp.]
MRTVFNAVTMVAILAGCTHASISSIPMEIEGVGTVYRYQGRANFSHQIAEADRLLTEHCKALNNGRPVIVDLQKRDLGMVTMGSGQSSTHFNATGTGTPYSTNLMGSATTFSSGTTSGMRNLNQEILFKCVAE